MTSVSPERRRTELLGTPVDLLSMAEVLALVEQWACGQVQRVAVGVNAHVANLAADDREFAALVRAADLAYADGQSVVWATRWLGAGPPERVATTDLIHPLAQMCAARGLTLYLFGAAPGVAQRAAQRLRAAEPELRVCTHHGYVDEAETAELVADINASGAAVLLVGLGDPMQQRWVAQNRASVTVPVILTCGGLFDWVSGDHRRPPRWVVGGGLEWLWRLRLEPRRLARRYLLGNPTFVARVVRQKFGPRPR